MPISTKPLTGSDFVALIYQDAVPLHVAISGFQPVAMPYRDGITKIPADQGVTANETVVHIRHAVTNPNDRPGGGCQHIDPGFHFLVARQADIGADMLIVR